MKATLLVTILMLSFQVSASDSRSMDQALETLQKSKNTRTQIENTLPKRELASLKQEEVALAQEFHNLMENDDDKEYFDQIDKLIVDKD